MRVFERVFPEASVGERRAGASAYLERSTTNSATCLSRSIVSRDLPGSVLRSQSPTTT